MTQATLIWFRDDLRLADNPALHAVARGGPLVALYILDEAAEGPRPLGGASRWWLAGALRALAAALAAHGVPLVLRRGPARNVVIAVAREIDAARVVWTRRYDPAAVAIDTAIKTDLRERGIGVDSFQGQLLFEPWTVRTRSGEPFRVFTPFWRAAQATSAPRDPLPAPTRLVGGTAPASDNLADWKFLEPHAPDWAGGLRASWTPGEAPARARLADFLAEGFRGYADGRDRPDRDHVSRLSPHLRFGEISPFQVWHAVAHAVAAGEVPARNGDKFLAELGWREFAHHLLFHQRPLATHNVQPRFDAFPWRNDDAALRAWRRGRTGYPLVDAGLRELWQTGWMHNRVRMVAASFLVKHLLIDWRHGERWFWDTLVDADAANNPASWQWVAGSGADAAPFFRIFNPVLQGEKFDPDGAYVRRFVPELARLPASHIHKPWLAPADMLARAGVDLGRDYPRPIVEHDAARRRALAALQSLADPPQ